MKIQHNAVLRRTTGFPGVAAALCLALLCAVPARAAFLDLGAGARATGMGNAFVAVDDDAYAIYYNPAGLALLEQSELATSYTKNMIGLSDGSSMSTSFVGFAQPLKAGWGTLGAAWQQFDLNGGLYSDQSMYLSYANRLSGLGRGDLYAGASGKFLHHGFGGSPEASDAMNGLVATGQADPVLSGRRDVNVFDADAGLLYRGKEHYSAGLAFTHITQPDVSFAGNGTDKLPLGIKLGLNRRSLLSNIGFQYETSRSPAQTRDHRLTMGLERWFPWLLVGNLGVRGAMTVGTRQFKQVSAGLSYKDSKISVDYSFSLPISALAADAGSHHISFSIRFGHAPVQEESVIQMLAAMRELKHSKELENARTAAELSGAQQMRLEEYKADAKALLLKARYREAMESLKQAVTLTPGDTDLVQDYSRLSFVATMVKELPDYRTVAVEETWHQGILAYLRGDDAQAVEKVSAAFTVQPDLKNLEIFLNQLEFVTGITRGGAAGAADLNLDQLLQNASQAVSSGHYTEAIAFCNKVIKRDPKNLTAWEDLGISYFALEEYPKWIETWEKTYELEKDPARWVELNGRLKAIKSPARKTEQEAEKVVAQEASAKAAGKQAEKIDQLLANSFAAIQEGRYSDAIPLCKDALKLSPDNLTAWENLGISYFALGQFPEWLETWEKTYKLEADPVRWSSLNSYMKLVRGNYVKAAHEPPQPAPAQIQLPAAQAATPPAQPASVPEAVQKLYNQGIDLYSSGNLEKAKAAFENVLRLDPQNAPAAKALKRVNEELKR